MPMERIENTMRKCHKNNKKSHENNREYYKNDTGDTTKMIKKIIKDTIKWQKKDKPALVLF